MPGAADRDAEATRSLGGDRDRCLDGVRVGHVDLVEAGPVTELGSQRLTLLAVQVRDHHVRTGAVEATDGGFAEARSPAADERAG